MASEALLEVVSMSLGLNVDLQDENHKKIWDDSLNTVSRQPGFKKLFWGRKTEDGLQDEVVWVVEWKTIASQTAFTQRPDHSTFISTLNTLLTTPPISSLTKLPYTVEADLLLALRAPVTECISAYFLPNQDEAEHVSNFAMFGEECGKLDDAGYSGLTGGWSIQPRQHPSLGEGIDGKMFVAFIGWPDIATHLRFRNHEGFLKNRHLLRGGAKAVGMWHVEFKEYCCRFCQSKEGDVYEE